MYEKETTRRMSKQWTILMLEASRKQQANVGIHSPQTSERTNLEIADFFREKNTALLFYAPDVNLQRIVTKKSGER